MQGKVVRLHAYKPPEGEDVGEAKMRATSDQARQYILDMVDQLGRLAADQGDPVLAAMLGEVVRRQGALELRNQA